mgnify:CR=1 FL=1
MIRHRGVQRRLAIETAQAIFEAVREGVGINEVQNFGKFRVTGPGFPSPICRKSISRMGVTSAAVPVRKTSSAM